MPLRELETVASHDEETPALRREKRQDSDWFEPWSFKEERTVAQDVTSTHEVLFCKSSCYDFRSLLPECAYHQVIADMADRDLDAIPFRNCSGPSIAGLRYMTIVTLVLNSIFLFYAYTDSTCTGSGFAKIEANPLLLMVPFGIVRLSHEWITHKYITIPYVQVTGHLGPPCMHIPYAYWLVWMMSVSVLQLVDLTTDTMFTARTLASDSCTGFKLTELWDHVSHVSGLNWMTPFAFDTVIATCWVVVNLQQIIPLLETTPRCCQDITVDYDVGDFGAGGRTSTHDFTNLLGELTNTGDALCLLGEANGMGTILQMGLFYPRAKEQNIRLFKQRKVKLAEQLARQMATMAKERGSFTGAQTIEFPFDVKKSFVYLQNALMRGIQRIGLVGVVENSFQMNLQVSVIAMKMALTGHTYHPSLGSEIFSVIVSLVVAVLKANEARFLLEFCWVVRKDLIYVSQQYSIRLETEYRHPYESMDAATQELYRTCRRYAIYVAVAAVLLLLAIVYGVLKFIFIFICDDKIWNFKGCVDLDDDFLAKLRTYKRSS